MPTGRLLQTPGGSAAHLGPSAGTICAPFGARGTTERDGLWGVIRAPVVIHVDPMQVLSLNKTCRYCPHCDLLIAHQDDLEHFLTAYFTEHQPEVV
ncbi:MAG TPA: hypothetical protein VKB35_15355, partial [Ktedonobacteraceae bacterium]|nr:hypothetical protein [Ktedonobacteraceae bacterium]